jgi:hypothetical protein
MRRRDIRGHGYVEISKYHMRAAGATNMGGYSCKPRHIASSMYSSSLLHEPSILRALTPSWSLLGIWQVEDLNVNVH